VYQGLSPPGGEAREALFASEVEMVRVAVPGALPVMLTGDVEPKLRVGGFFAPAGLDVMAAVKATLPVKPPAGVTVTVVVSPVVAPAVTVIGLPLTLMLGGATTFIDAVPVAIV